MIEKNRKEKIYDGKVEGKDMFDVILKNPRIEEESEIDWKKLSKELLELIYYK